MKPRPSPSRSPAADVPPPGRGALLAAAVAAGAAALVYLPSLGGGFVWDDLEYVVTQGRLGLWRALSSDLYAGNPGVAPSGYYRPVAVASYWLCARLGGGPLPFHALNLLLHACCAALLALLLARRLGRVDGAIGAALPATLAAAAWALHPEQVETVAWISCRYDLLAAAAALALLVVPWRPGAARAALHGLLFLCGLLSKEGFLSMAAMVLADDWAARRPWRAALARWMSVAAAIGVWAGLRAALRIAPLAPPALTSFPRDLLSVIALYLGRAVAPLPLTVSHPYASAGPAGLAAGALVLLALLLAARRWRALAPAAALFLAGLVPIAVAAPQLGSAAERYFYLPSLGLAWFLGAGLSAARAAGPRAFAVASAASSLAALAGALLVVERLPAWRSDRSLFAAAAGADPDDAVANLRLGLLEAKAGNLDEARRLLERGQRREPGSARIANALAWLQLRRGDAPAARAAASRAVELAPGFPQAWLHLAAADHVVGAHEEELAALARALALSPGFREARIARAFARCELERRPECEADLDALAAEGQLAGADQLVARVEAALRRRDTELAAERLARLRAARPDDPRLRPLAAALAAQRAQR